MLVGILEGQGVAWGAAVFAAVAFAGYAHRRRAHVRRAAAVDPQLKGELDRAQHIACDLDQVAERLGSNAANQRASVAAFQTRVRAIQAGVGPADWQALGRHVDSLLTPTLQLITNLSLARDQLRAHQARLMTYSGARVDHSTGLHNRRSMDEQLAALLASHAGGKQRLAVALFSAGEAQPEVSAAGEDRVQSIARLLEECVRGNDVAARYSHDEFVVIMPQTPLAGALVFGERLIRLSHARLGYPLWGGVVETADDESPERLLSRAHSALYSARTQPAACLFQHTGASVRRHEIELGQPAESAAGGVGDKTPSPRAADDLGVQEDLVVACC